MLVKVVEELLVVVELHVPLARLRVAEVVAQRDQENGRAKEAGLLAVLVQQEESSEGTGREPPGLFTPPSPVVPGPALAHLSWTFCSVIGCGCSLHGQVSRLPGSRWKSNWQQTDGFGPHVCGTS